MSAVRKSVFAIGSIPPLRSLCAEHLGHIEIRVVDDVRHSRRGDGRAGKGVHLGQVCADRAGRIARWSGRPVQTHLGLLFCRRVRKGDRLGSPSSALLLSMAAYSLRRATASALESSGGASSSSRGSPFRAERVSPAAYILRVASASGEVSEGTPLCGVKIPGSSGLLLRCTGSGIGGTGNGVGHSVAFACQRKGSCALILGRELRVDALAAKAVRFVLERISTAETLPSASMVTAACTSLWKPF